MIDKKEIIQLILESAEKGMINRNKLEEYKSFIEKIDDDNTSAYLRNKQIKQSISDGIITQDEYSKICFTFSEEFSKDFELLDKCFYKCSKDGGNPANLQLHRLLAEKIRSQGEKMLGENIAK